jgi:alkylresorcinol/alkylpyrone synthase
MNLSGRDREGPEAHGDAVIAATATALPEHSVSREEVKAYLGEVFPLDGARLDTMMAVVDHSEIRRRFCIHPVDYLIRPRSLERISQEYQEHTIRLGREAASDCLRHAGARPEEIDLIITVSCTGVMIPSLDAHLVNDMGFRSDVKRLPITELGCAAGASAVARAWEFLRAYPGRNVLIVAVELPSLTFQRENLTQANLISSILFGDGAAAALVAGRANSGPRILDADSYLFPRSIDAMGFDLKETGFHIVLSRDVPEMIRGRIRDLVGRFLARHGLCLEKIDAFVLHPGGRKLLCSIEEELGLSPDDTGPSWDVLREYGNLSSASVLFVLHEWLAKRRVAPGGYGLMAAFGPGFSAEQVLLQWT